VFSGNSWYTGYFPDLPEPVWLHCMAKINSSVLYFIGGFPERKTYFYNAITNQWLAGPALNVPRAGHSCSVFNWLNPVTDLIEEVLVSQTTYVLTILQKARPFLN
jgi:hypothetical protein